MTDFEYHIIRNNRLSSRLSLRVSSEKGVVVRAPFWMPKKLIDGFVWQKQTWIKKHLQTISANKKEKKYSQGEKHLFFGQEYPLNISLTSIPGRGSVKLQNNEIQIKLFRGGIIDTSPEKIKKLLLHWYLEKGIEMITAKANYFSDKMGVDYTKINIKKVTSIWGSCSPQKTLCFNRKLVMAPHGVVDYVVIHELAHLRHRNHSADFWNLVMKFDPQCKDHRKWLRKNHHLLDI